MDSKVEELKAKGKPEEDTQVNMDNTPGPPKLKALEIFVKAEEMSLKSCEIVNLKGFPRLPLLKKLDLSSNNITSTLFFLNYCPQLTHLNLSNNKIKEPYALKSLVKLKNLEWLSLENCEITKTAEYRRKVFYVVKQLKTLDGVDKTEDDGVKPTEDILKPKMTDDPMDGSSMKRKTMSPGSLKKKLKAASQSDKNALMRLNELKPGLKYVVESVGGPPHNPEFVVSVVVNDTKFVGNGNSKQAAKHAAAQAALESFIQFRNTPEMMNIMRRSDDVSDFTMDNLENESSFNQFNIHKNGANLSKPGEKMSFKSPKEKKSLTRDLSEADKKNPVMLLNEIQPGLVFKLMEENSAVPSQRFCMSVEVNGVVYEGTGPNKKQAKASAARSVLSEVFKVNYNAYGSTYIPSDGADAEIFDFPQAVADKIAKQLMATFNEVMVGSADFSKWKIIAGIAMTKGENMEDIEIVSIGTGTKCINGEHISMVGANLNDCHAEIISRRCLKDFFYSNLEMHLEGEGDQSIFKERPEGGFQLRPHIKFHLYISTAPCGDARIFCPHEEGILDAVDRHPNRNSRGVLRTKIESGEGTIPIKSTQGVQTWDGILPGHERLLTMSCSDKLASWNILGVQGALLSHFLEPIYLDSVVLGGLFHPNHLCRALFKRFEGHVKPLPKMFRMNRPKLCAISSPETRQLSKSPNFSVNWTRGLGRAEVVNSTTGKTEGGQVSRLAKRVFFQRFMNIYDRISHVDKFKTPQPGLYTSYKESVSSYQEAKKVLTLAFKEAGLGIWVKKPVEQNEFELLF